MDMGWTRHMDNEEQANIAKYGDPDAEWHTHTGRHTHTEHSAYVPVPDEADGHSHPLTHHHVIIEQGHDHQAEIEAAVAKGKSKKS